MSLLQQLYNISIKKYRIAVPMPSKNVRNAVSDTNQQADGEQDFIIHSFTFTSFRTEGFI